MVLIQNFYKVFTHNKRVSRCYIVAQIYNRAENPIIILFVNSQSRIKVLQRSTLNTLYGIHYDTVGVHRVKVKNPFYQTYMKTSFIMFLLLI